MPSPQNPQSLNRYSYTLNNPVKYIDPTGHYEFEEDPADPIVYSTGQVRSKYYYTHPEYNEHDITDGEIIIAATAPIWVPAVAVGGEAVVETIGAGIIATWQTLYQTAIGLSSMCLLNNTCARIIYGVVPSPSSSSGEVVKFTDTAAQRMQNPGRWVPPSLIDSVVKSPETIWVPDPQRAASAPDAVRTVVTLFAHGKEYLLEIVYDPAANRILHFMYDDPGKILPLQ